MAVKTTKQDAMLDEIHKLIRAYLDSCDFPMEKEKKLRELIEQLEFEERQLHHART